MTSPFLSMGRVRVPLGSLGQGLMGNWEGEDSLSLRGHWGAGGEPTCTPSPHTPAGLLHSLRGSVINCWIFKALRNYPILLFSFFLTDDKLGPNQENNFQFFLSQIVTEPRSQVSHWATQGCTSGQTPVGGDRGQVGATWPWSPPLLAFAVTSLKAEDEVTTFPTHITWSGSTVPP